MVVQGVVGGSRVGLGYKTVWSYNPGFLDSHPSCPVHQQVLRRADLASIEALIVLYRPYRIQSREYRSKCHFNKHHEFLSGILPAKRTCTWNCFLGTGFFLIGLLHSRSGSKFDIRMRPGGAGGYRGEPMARLEMAVRLFLEDTPTPVVAPISLSGA